MGTEGMQYGEAPAAELWTIDDAYIENAGKELDALADYIERTINSEWDAISARFGADPTKSPFGGAAKLSQAPQLYAKHDTYLQTARNGYRKIAEDLRRAAAAARTVASNYKTAEERNRANAAEIENAFSGNAPTAATAATAAASTNAEHGGY